MKTSLNIYDKYILNKIGIKIFDFDKKIRIRMKHISNQETSICEVKQLESELRQ